MNPVLREELFPRGGEDVSAPRGEHPRPQLFRPGWSSLNGPWQFELDHADEGIRTGMLERELEATILVPFAPESERSGIGDPAFHEAVWYRREIAVPEDWETTHRVLLHFQAVDHDATVWLNGVEVGRHRGGFTPFTVDITDALDESRSGILVVRARDHRHEVQARGKQATWEHNTHAYYTRTTGIWQSVWLESAPPLHVLRPAYEFDADGTALRVRVPLSGYGTGTVTVTLRDHDGDVARSSVRLGSSLEPDVRLELPAERVRLWSLDDPFLYGLSIVVEDDTTGLSDTVDSYVGLRTLAIVGHSVLLNDKPVFQRLVLDQGYWPDTLMTAPSDEALVRDIELARDAGFNGARVHQKVAEERYLFHADRLGYLVWGEFADWGASGQGRDGYNQRPTPGFIDQWIDVLVRDRNHPSIVGWCPLNETYQVLHDRMTVLDDVTRAMFWATKHIDPSRPVIDASGYSHRVAATDVWDSHDYEQDPEQFARNHARLAEGAPHTNRDLEGREYSLPYRGQPFMVSEFGGIWWAQDSDRGASGEARDSSWGYGQRIADEDAFYERFTGLVEVLAGNPLMFGYCYTQLTDVFQEQNGIYRFDRGLKLDIARIRDVQSTVPAYERG